MSSVETPDGAPEIRKKPRTGRRRIVLGAVAVAIIVGTFAFALPKIADYRDVWDVVTTLTWEWCVVLLAATVAQPGHVRAAVDGGAAGPPASGRRSWSRKPRPRSRSSPPPAPRWGSPARGGCCASWGFRSSDVTRAVTLTGVWNQLANLFYPVVAVFLLKVNGGQTALLGTAAFIGVAVFGVVVAFLALVLYSGNLAREVGDAVAAFVSWFLARVRRGPVTWDGSGFARFRDDAVDLLARRWHVLTLATLAGSLTVFLLLAAEPPRGGGHGLRGDVGGGVRGVGARADHRDDPDHAGRHRRGRARPHGGARRLRRRQRGRRRGGADLPVPHDGADTGARRPRGAHVALAHARRAAVVELPGGRSRPRDAERGRVKEQSHKSEMGAALRGDFERLRARRGGESGLIERGAVRAARRRTATGSAARAPAVASGATAPGSTAWGRGRRALPGQRGRLRGRRVAVARRRRHRLCCT